MSLRRPETAAKGVELDYLVPSTVYRLRVPSILCFCPFFYVHFVFSTAIFCRILSPFMYVLRFVPTSAFCPVFFVLLSAFTFYLIPNTFVCVYYLPSTLQCLRLRCVLYRLHLLSTTFDVNLLYSYPSPIWLFLVRRRPVLPLRLLWAGEMR